MISCMKDYKKALPPRSEPVEVRGPIRLPHARFISSRLGLQLGKRTPSSSCSAMQAKSEPGSSRKSPEHLHSYAVTSQRASRLVLVPAVRWVLLCELGFSQRAHPKLEQGSKVGLRGVCAFGVAPWVSLLVMPVRAHRSKVEHVPWLRMGALGPKDRNYR